MTTSRTYHMDDCVISLPAGYKDRSVNVLEWKTPSGDSVALTVQREPLGEAQLEEYVVRETKEMPQTYRGFHVERDEAATLADAMAVWHKAFRWNKQTDVIYNHMAFVVAGPLVIIFVATAKARHREDADRVIDEAIQNLRIRES